MGATFWNSVFKYSSLINFFIYSISDKITAESSSVMKETLRVGAGKGLKFAGKNLMKHSAIRGSSEDVIFGAGVFGVGKLLERKRKK